MTKPVKNIADVALRDFGDDEGRFAAKIGSFGKEIGSIGIGVMLHVVEAGKKAFPFHNHHAKHEMFIILEGEGTYRFGKEEYPVRAGDVCAAPTGGPEVAHQIINSGKTTLKYLGISTAEDPEVVEYPDSGKIAAMARFNFTNPEAGGVRFIGRQDASIDYFDGEK